MPIFLPALKLAYFAPFLIISYYRYGYFIALFFSYCAGLLIDLYCVETRLGFYTLVYIATTVVLYEKKQRFFEDNASTLPIMSFLFGVVSTAFQWILLFFLERSVTLTIDFFVADFLVMPALDALYSLLFIPLFFRRSFKRTQHF